MEEVKFNIRQLKTYAVLSSEHKFKSLWDLRSQLAQLRETKLPGRGMPWVLVRMHHGERVRGWLASADTTEMGVEFWV